MTNYAYVSVLYGNNIYITGAMVLGYSLMKTKTTYDRVILVTPDVSDEYINYLKLVWNVVIPINYISSNPKFFTEANMRFIDVFTKLECLSLIQYDKIILLDLDMIIVNNIDHLFQLHTPAASLKKNNIKYGDIIDRKYMCRNGKVIKSINAGLMLLKPDIDELNEIKYDIVNNKEISYYHCPEQEYLSLRYCGKWRFITFNYNYQFGLDEFIKNITYSLDQIYVIHYSCPFKPWNLLINKIVTEKEINFRLQHKKYFDFWVNAYMAIKNKYAKKNILLPY